MEVTRSELEKKFQRLADDYLLQQYQSGTLTDIAQAIALQELRNRGIKLPRDHLQVAQTQPSKAAIHSDLVPLNGYFNWAEAQVLVSMLQAKALPAHASYEQLTANNQARVWVHTHNVEQAQSTAAALKRGDFAIDDEFDGNDA